MSVATVFCAIIFSIFSTSVLTYISLATPIGPWMGPTLALIGVFLARFLRSFTSEKILYSVVAGSLGGIMATAFGFSFPTLYFLDKPFFQAWIANPFSFIASVALLAAAAGMLGLWVASLIARNLVYEQQLAFPVGVLVYKIASAFDNKGSLLQLIGGFVVTTLYCLVQGLQWFQLRFIPAVLTLTPSYKVGWISFPAIQCTMGLMPMLWAIGFIAGSMITVPLLVGTLSKIFIIDFINKWWFADLSVSDFLFAFCSGMVVIGALSSFFTMPLQLWEFLKKTLRKDKATFTHRAAHYAMIPVLALVGTMFWWFEFSFLSQLYITLFSMVCAYQIAVFAGRVGLAPLGRFATFVMVPGMLFFGLNPLQITILATFVEACGGVTTDALFGKKAGLLGGLDQKMITRYQLLGIGICSVTVGVVMWVLVTHFQLGSEILFAERAQGRALLVNAAGFNYYVLVCGAVYGLLLKKCGFNPMLVLGGLLMPLSLTLGLVMGGISSSVVGKEVDYEPLCSGMFAANSLCMIFQALFFKS
jgi:hypothetical protein